MYPICCLIYILHPICFCVIIRTRLGINLDRRSGGCSDTYRKGVLIMDFDLNLILSIIILIILADIIKNIKK